MAESSGDPAGKAVACGASEHEDFLWATLFFSRLGDVNFLTNFGLRNPLGAK
jgi:hypothetical protein